MLLITADERTLLLHKDNESAGVRGEKQTAEERGERWGEEETKRDRSTKHRYHKCNYGLTTHVETAKKTKGEKTRAGQEMKKREICERV